MEHPIKQFKFIKEDNDRWYIELPEWTGSKADLEMVEGADTMLDYVGKGNNEVVLQLSEVPFPGASILTSKHDYSKETGGGGIYFLKDYLGEELNQELWLCEVTEFVFGRLPAEIYFKDCN